MVGSGGVVLCLDYLCRWQVQLSVYCAWHPVFNPVAPYGYLLSDIICLWQISQIPTFLFRVV